MNKSYFQNDLKKFIFLLLTFSVNIILYFGFNQKENASMLVAVIAISMAILWISEAIPLGITALIPLFAFPLFGIISTKKIASAYMNSTILLFIGGFFVARAMEKWNLHRRIALNILNKFSSSQIKLIIGFILATLFLSMWISNTAAALMMLSIALSVIKSFEEMKFCEHHDHFATALLLSIAYSASIGGMGTLIGTPPNLAFSRIYIMSFPENAEVTFGTWMSFAIPLVICLALSLFLVLYVIHLKYINKKPIPQKVITDQLESLGPITFEQKVISFLFGHMAFLWIFRKKLNLGIFEIPGWSEYVPNGNLIDDGTIAIVIAIIMFCIPTSNQKRLLDKTSINEIPWGTILLFGGGFALAKGINSSGLAIELGTKLSSLSNFSDFSLIMILSSFMTFFTEVTSNTASTEMALPILAGLSKVTGIAPLKIMIPVTLAASAAFMLPAATPPNAIVFGSGILNIKDMVKVGLILNLISILIITIFSSFIIPLFL